MQAYPLSGWKSSWLDAQSALQQLSYKKDVAATFAWNGERAQIPRADLPFGTLRWQGTSDDRGQRGRIGGAVSPDYYKVTMPRWASELAPEPLSEGEAGALQDAEG
jgi:hypothetical protein